MCHTSFALLPFHIYMCVCIDITITNVGILRRLAHASMEINASKYVNNVGSSHDVFDISNLLNNTLICIFIRATM